MSVPPSLTFLGAIKEVQEHPQLEVNGGINTYFPLICVLSYFFGGETFLDVDIGLLWWKKTKIFPLICIFGGKKLNEKTFF